MENQVKVKQVQQYSDSQGDHTICEGKLLFIQYDYGTHPNKIGEICNFGGEYRIAGVSDVGYPVVRPIIISETEEIEAGEWIIFGENRLLLKVKSVEKHEDTITLINRDGELIIRYLSSCRKVLALPKQFSPKHLQAIVDGKMKDGDKVLVNCVIKRKDGKNIYYISINQQNHITLFPAKQSLEEVADIWSTNIDNVHPADSYIAKQGFIAGAEWAKKNNY